MGRNRIEFPFNPAGSNTFTGAVIFNGQTTFNDGTTFNAGFGTTSFVVTGAGPSQWLNGTVEQYLAGSNVQVFAGSVWTFNNSPTFQAGITVTGNAGTQSSLGSSPANGQFMRAVPGTVNDYSLLNPTAASFYMTVPTGSLIPVFPQGLKPSATSSALSDYQENISFTPVQNAFVIVNGTGGVTFTGHYVKIGKFCHYEIVATLTGTATLAATAGVSFFSGLPVAVAAVAVPNHATDGVGTNYGHGFTNPTSHYSPTIAATHGAGFIIWTLDAITT